VAELSAAALKAPTQYFLWLDLEMSGLDVDTCRILEVAAIITDLELREVASYEAIVYQPAEVLESMDAWCTRQHGESGLTAAVATGQPVEVVDTQVAELAGRFWKRSDRAILAGNSIATDRRFVDRYMPKLAGKLHYRMLDVSSWKVMLKGRYGVDFAKAGAHRAVGDIRESIAEMGHYLSLLDTEKLASSTTA